MKSNSPVRVLYVNGGTMDMGGISSYMMNYYRNIDRSKVSIDFLVHGEGGIYDNEIVESGSQIYHVPTKRENIISNYRLIKHAIKAGKYDIVHCHMDTMNGYVLKIAQELQVPIRISHSHNT
ncbi:MAG: glycosyltransferase, partial [Clostridia bacterium]|nr:glycosyltransferase [Clostridia bacterium]